jgi:hypothetical protein
MPLQDVKSGNNYIKITRLYISSADRNESSPSTYDYIIDLDRHLQYCVGFEVTGYNFPTAIAPTFVPEKNLFPGNNKLDFSITAGVTSIFTVTWPSNQFTYQNNAVPYLSYVDALQQLLNQAIASDPVFGVGAPNEAFFSTVADPNLHTSLSVSGAGVLGFRFLFASGPNSANSAYLPMGYPKADTATALSSVSAGPTRLSPFRFIDINIDAAREFRPLKRVYISDQQSFGSVRNDLDITRTRLLSTQPVRSLERLRVTITLENGEQPPETGRDHDFTLTVFSVQNEINLPSWLNQTFVL